MAGLSVSDYPHNLAGPSGILKRPGLLVHFRRYCIYIPCTQIISQLHYMRRLFPIISDVDSPVDHSYIYLLLGELTEIRAESPSQIPFGPSIHEEVWINRNYNVRCPCHPNHFYNQVYLPDSRTVISICSTLLTNELI